MAVAQAPPSAGDAGTPGPIRRSRRRRGDQIFSVGTALIAFGLVALLALLIYELFVGAWPAFRQFGWGFFTGTNWNPVAGREQFGALPFIVGTLVTSSLAIVLATPVAVGLALLLNEVHQGWFTNPLAVFVDLLAAIPSVVYGLWGLFIMKPFFDRTVEPFLTATLGRIPIVGALFQGNANGGDLFTAGVILAVMILPIVTAVTREVIAVVPRELREGSLALGATRYETIRMAVLPYARSGIVGASMLGLGRALGETIAVSLVVGNGLGLGVSLFRPGYTIPAIIASEFREATSVGVHRSALLALALVLVLIAMLFAALSRLLVQRSGRQVNRSAAEVTEGPALQMTG